MRKITHRCGRLAIRIVDAVYEYGPAIILAGAFAGYLTWTAKWFH